MVEFEWFFGLLILLGGDRRATRGVAIIAFLVFGLVSLYRGVNAEISCHCFGVFGLSPWITLTIDVAAVTALVVVRSSASTTRTPVFTRILLILTVSFWVGVPWGIAVATREPITPRVVLDPAVWIGKRLPIMDLIETREDLSTKLWTLVLHRHNCQSCRTLMPGYLERARNLSQESGSPRLALIEIPPFSTTPTSDLPAVAIGRLRASKTWVVPTPIEINLVDGIVTSSVIPEDRTETSLTPSASKGQPQ